MSRSEKHVSSDIYQPAGSNPAVPLSSARETHSIYKQQTGKPWSYIERPEKSATRVTAFDRWLSQKLLDGLNQPPLGIRLWNGEVTPPKNKPARTLLTLNDRRAMFKLILNPELHFGDLYSSGRVEVSGDLVRMLEDVYYSLEDGQQSLLQKIIHRMGYRRLVNNLSACRDHIHHHYDISNDFYKLWLDREEMQYTCAYFPNPAMTIEQAQVAKLHHICRKLQLKPGDTVAEAGCGWGGLARFMAKHYGVKVRAYNISHQQILFARDKAREQGLSDLVEYVEDDYRNMDGEYDVFVSVGMLEHVGKNYYQTMGQVIDRVLKEDGRGLIHTIGRVQASPMNAWIERRIFPGAYPPPLSEMMNIFEPNDFAVQDVENLRLHYAKTLDHWMMRFEENVETITEMLDEEFVRAWRLYLAGSIAAFTTGQLQLFQVVFNRKRSNQLPWSRSYMYSAAD